MKTQNSMLHFMFVIVSLALLAAFTSACSFNLPTQGRISQVIDLSLDEDLFSHSSPSFKIHGQNFWDSLDVVITRMELHDGFLRFLGTRLMPDGSLVPCSIDVSLGTEGGMLTARIIAVDIPGITLNDPIIADINQEMEVDMRFDEFDPHADVHFEEVQVTEQALRMKIKVDIRF